MFLLEATRGILPEKVPVSRIAILAVWIILALPAVALPAAPEIFLQEEPETYLVIDKLEGMGFLPGLMRGGGGRGAGGGRVTSPGGDRRMEANLYAPAGGGRRAGEGN